ncbi:MAG: transketolase [Candidatus Diapherotrites archaeon]|nr:transketolase [Candidatus Diapherotrites archaeon]
MRRLTKKKIRELEEIARQIRVLSLQMTSRAESGHPGGSLSVADIIACLYFHKMRINPRNPKWPERDRFILSKGHSCPAQYAALALLGIIPARELNRLREVDSMLQGHPDRNKTPGIETVSGTLGQGFSVACGMALAAKLDGKKHKVYVVLGDGELQEGIVWEAVMFAGFRRLNNLVAIIDHNKCQNDGFLHEILDVTPIAEKFRAFRWNTCEIDGHNIKEIVRALDEADKSEKPVAIIAHTVKGKGVSFMEHKPEWHGKALPSDLLEKALEELGNYA